MARQGGRQYRRWIKKNKYTNSVRKRCSCFWCGNYRKWYGKTLRELKADLSFQEETQYD